MQIIKWLLCRIFGGPSKPIDRPMEIARAHQLIAAIDAGGIPLDPKRITKVAEDLGLEVSRKEQSKVTIERIRAALKRC